MYLPFETKVVKIDSSVQSWVQFAISQGTNYKTLKILNPWMTSKGLENKLKKVYSIQLPIAGSGLDNVGATSNKYGAND
jgi:hypothetical protein